MRLILAILLLAAPAAAEPDSRADLQALIDATPSGGTLLLPDGVFEVSGSPLGYYGLRLALPITLRGSGATVLRQRAGTPLSYRLIQIDAPGVTLDQLELDGNAAALTVDTHRHGVFIEAPGARLRDVEAHDFQGDGVYLYNGASGALLDGANLHDNRRNGATLSGQIDGVAIRGGDFSGNVAQQIDSEPGAPWVVTGVTITDAVVTSPSEYAITVSGSGSAYRSSGWRIVGCTIVGGVNVVWADSVAIVDNAITSATDKPAVKVYRTANGVTIARNRLTMTLATAASPSAVYVLGTGPGQAATDVTVAGNAIAVAAPSSFGVRVQGAIAVTLVGNAITGPGVTSAGAAGVYVRATDVTTPIREVTVAGNTITGFGARGVSVAGYVSGSAALIAVLRLVGNAVGGSTGPQTAGAVTDDGTHPVVRLSAVDNSYGSAVTSGRIGESPL